MNQDFPAVSPGKLAPRIAAFAVALCILFFSISGANAQSRSYTSVAGTVVDPSGAVVPGAIVEIRNPVSQFERSVTTDTSGAFIKSSSFALALATWVDPCNTT